MKNITSLLVAVMAVGSVAQAASRTEIISVDCRDQDSKLIYSGMVRAEFGRDGKSDDKGDFKGVVFAIQSGGLSAQICGTLDQNPRSLDATVTDCVLPVENRKLLAVISTNPIEQSTLADGSHPMDCRIVNRIPTVVKK